MSKILYSWIISSISIIIVDYVLDGVDLDSYLTAVVLAAVLGVLNSLVRPLLIFFTLPINILTLGLFTFVINAAMVLLAEHFVSGFMVDGFFRALLFSIFLSIVNGVLNLFFKD